MSNGGRCEFQNFLEASVALQSIALDLFLFESEREARDCILKFRIYFGRKTLTVLSLRKASSIVGSVKRVASCTLDSFATPFVKRGVALVCGNALPPTRNSRSTRACIQGRHLRAYVFLLVVFIYLFSRQILVCESRGLTRSLGTRKDWRPRRASRRVISHSVLCERQLCKWHCVTAHF